VNLLIWSEWIQGGPFIEVSFLIELKEKKSKTVKNIINKLSEVSTKIEIVDYNIDEIIDFFDKGYPYDDDNPQSPYIHSLKLRLFVDLPRRRKASLLIDKISSDSILIDFCFFGDEMDVPEWDQIGIRKDEYSDITNFLIELFSVYEFKIGGVSCEEDIKFLFETVEQYPDECYRFKNIDPEYFLNNPSLFNVILWNEKYKKLNENNNKNKRLNNDGILIFISEI
jgi:hypothetical protein